MRLVVSAVRLQLRPSSALVAASLRNGLDLRVSVGVNDATNAAKHPSVYERRSPLSRIL